MRRSPRTSLLTFPPVSDGGILGGSELVKNYKPAALLHPPRGNLALAITPENAGLTARKKRGGQIFNGWNTSTAGFRRTRWLLESRKMDPAILASSIAPSPAQQRLAVQARLLRTLSLLSQIGLMATLFLLWKQFNWPFSKAFEKCFVGGVLVYIVLGSIASILMTMARLQPFHMLLRQFLGIVSLVIFGALHYVYGMSILKSAAAWLLIYAASRILVLRIEKRAMSRFRVN